MIKHKTPLTRTSATEEAYKRNGMARQIICALSKWAEQHKGTPLIALIPGRSLIEGLVHVLSFFVPSFRDKAPATLRHCFASLTFMIVETCNGHGMAVSQALYRFGHQHDLFNKPSCKRTCAKKARRFLGNDREILLDRLLTNSMTIQPKRRKDECRNSANAITWAFCFLLTLFGTRPVEIAWMRLIFEGGDSVRCRVANAKHTNGRSHGPTRSLSYDSLTAQQIDQIKWAIFIMRGAYRTYSDYPRPWKSICQLVARTLRRHVRQQFGRSLKRNYTLYTFRHQLSADLKRANRAPAHIAALMGHAVSSTAHRHYAKARSGKCGHALPNANLDEVARVKDDYQPFDSQKLSVPVPTMYGGHSGFSM